MGDSYYPETFENELRESDGIVHTIATLIDTTVTKRAKPGDPGTYEYMCR